MPRPRPLANLCFRYSAHTFGDCILPRGGQGENGPFDSFAPPLLKNALTTVLIHNAQADYKLCILISVPY
jgi:hypothetical protein